MANSIKTTAVLDKVLVTKEKATLTITMGPEMLYLAPRLAEIAGEGVVVSIAPQQGRLPMDGYDE